MPSRAEVADFIKRVNPNAKGGAWLDARLWRELPA